MFGFVRICLRAFVLVTPHACPQQRPKAPHPHPVLHFLPSIGYSLFNFNHSCGCVTTVSHCGFKIALPGVLGVNASSLGLYFLKMSLFTHTHTHTLCFKNRVFSLDIEISVDKLFPNSCGFCKVLPWTCAVQPLAKAPQPRCLHAHPSA